MKKLELIDKSETTMTNQGHIQTWKNSKDLKTIWAIGLAYYVVCEILKNPFNHGPA